MRELFDDSVRVEAEDGLLIRVRSDTHDLTAGVHVLHNKVEYVILGPCAVDGRQYIEAERMPTASR